MKDNYEVNVKKNQFETPESYSVKNSDKTQDNETIRTQNRYEVLFDSDERDINGCNNYNGKLCNTVTVTILSKVNLRNNDVKKDQHKYKK